MALVTETGSGLSTAEAYATVAGFKAYCDARGITYGTDSVIEQLLRKGTDYLTEAYRSRWAGERVGTVQALDWPRFYVPYADTSVNDYYPSTIVPAEVVRANIECAIRAATTTLNADRTQAVKRKKVGTVEVEYQDNTTTKVTLPAITGMLRPLLTGTGVRLLKS